MNIITVIQKIPDENNSCEEYKLQHPSWLVNKVADYKMDCDFQSDVWRCIFGFEYDMFTAAVS
jgi:hypothetical protein